MREGWDLGGKTNYIAVTSPSGVKIKFDIVIPTKRGCVFAACFKRCNEIMAIHSDGSKVVMPPPMLTVNEAHAKFGHCSEALTRKTAHGLGINLKGGSFQPCAACGMGKAKQRNVPKSTESDEPAVGERIHADICTIREKFENKHYVRPNWFMMVDATNFGPQKQPFIEPTCEVLHRWIA
jgi:hypothetical protein